MSWSPVSISPHGDNLIFLISQPRAGSTMLQKILGSHPWIHTVSEPWIALHPLFALRESGSTADFDQLLGWRAVNHFLNDLPEGEEAYYEGLRRMIGYLYSRALQQSGKRVFLDKTPRYYFIVPELRRLFPRAKIVFLLRNPVAVLSSILESWCPGNPAMELGSARHDLMTAPELILRGIREAGAGAIVARYEEIVSQPETAIRRLCHQLGVAFHPAMIHYGQGAENQPRWFYGDQETVYREKAPVTERADRWRRVFHQAPKWGAWARGYLAALGPSTIREMGYRYEDLCRALPFTAESDAWPSLMRFDYDQARRDRGSRMVERQPADTVMSRTAVKA